MSNIVRYGRLVNLGNYENERLELEEEVQPGETREEAYLRVRAEVHTLLKRADPLRNIQAKIENAQHQAQVAERRTAELLRHWRTAADKYAELRALLALHGIEFADLPSHLVPAPPPSSAQPADQDDDQDDDDQDDGL